MNEHTFAGAVADPLAFSCTEVTGTREMDVSGIDGHRTVADVAASMAALLDLPRNVPWAMRDDSRARMLEADMPLGSQIPATGARLVCIPQSHLG